MNDEQIPFAEAAITRIVMENVPKAKGGQLARQCKVWSIVSLTSAFGLPESIEMSREALNR